MIEQISNLLIVIGTDHTVLFRPWAVTCDTVKIRPWSAYQPQLYSYFTRLSIFILIAFILIAATLPHSRPLAQVNCERIRALSALPALTTTSPFPFSPISPSFQALGHQWLAPAVAVPWQVSCVCRRSDSGRGLASPNVHRGCGEHRGKDNTIDIQRTPVISHRAAPRPTRRPAREAHGPRRCLQVLAHATWCARRCGTNRRRVLPLVRTRYRKHARPAPGRARKALSPHRAQ